MAANVAVLGLYQFTAAALRGVRAYSAAAGLETISAINLLVLSCAAALGGSTSYLLAAYAISNFLPLAWYAIGLMRYARGHAGGASATAWPKLDKFAIWSLARLLMMMTFGVVAISGVQWLTPRGLGAKENVAEFAMPYRIAQLLGYVAVTLWAANYGIATRAWAHGQKRRARLTLLRTARLGGALLIFSAGGALFVIDVIALLLPEEYRAAFYGLFPAMLAMFLWYGLAAFYTVLGDLEERPWRGAAMWMIIVWIQLVLVATGSHFFKWNAQQAALWGSCIAAGVGALVIGPAFFWRPVRLTAVAVPLGVFAIVPLGFLPPWGLAWWIGVPAVAASLLFVWGAGLLIRPRDKRALRRMRERRNRSGLEKRMIA
jgi:hypothetical protein